MTDRKTKLQHIQVEIGMARHIVQQSTLREGMRRRYTEKRQYG
jgi:hypothetical protein